MAISLSYPTKTLNGSIHLTSSKSESNRALIIQALCKEYFGIHNLSTADDTVILSELLSSESSELNVNMAGTAMRFLTALKSITPGEWSLTGADRMKNRPIKGLVDTLRAMGATIEYIEKDGYPPLKIIGTTLKGGKITMDGSVSSQFISAVLMIAPNWQNGLQIDFSGEIVSKAYIDMTMEMMLYFGVDVRWVDKSIKVKSGTYKAKLITIEADWSAASYWYSMVALVKQGSITIYGLNQQSLQGDIAVKDIYENFGVHTEFIEDGIRLSKTNNLAKSFEYDFSDCPDLAQTVAVTCAALDIPATLTGLKTLRIKETDRIAALQYELSQLGAVVVVQSDQLVIQSGVREFEGKTISTYDDHRMAMAFAPLALKNSIKIDDETVVAKSYPNFWKDLQYIGFVKN